MKLEMKKVGLISKYRENDNLEIKMRFLIGDTMIFFYKNVMNYNKKISNFFFIAKHLSYSP